jgi:hypothetical protein
MEGTHDDLLAVAASICVRSMADIKKMAVTLGMRPKGPFNMDEVLFRKILFNCSNYLCSDYKDFLSIAALPDFCVLCCDYSTFDESFRHVTFRHFRGTTTQQAHSVVIDPLAGIDPKLEVTSSFGHLKLEPGSSWFLEITQKNNPAGKGK